VAAVRLLVCDAPSLRLEELLPGLREIGYECAYVQPAGAARAEPPWPDALLVSAELDGGAHGGDFRHLRDLFPGIPLLVVTPVRSFSLALDFFRAGAADLLALPIAAEEMAERIRIVCARLRPEEPIEVPVEVPIESPAAGRETPAEPFVPLAALPCGAVLLDEEGRVRHANAIALSLLGQPDLDSLRESLDTSFSRFEPQDEGGRSLPASAWPARRALRDKVLRSATVSLRRPDRTRVWLHVEARPQMEAGRVRGLTLTLCNVTAARAALRPSNGKPASAGKR